MLIPNAQQNPLGEKDSDNFLPPFIGAHLRSATVRELGHLNSATGSHQYVHFDASESLSTITVDHNHSQVFDIVIDSRERDETVSKLNDLWESHLQQALFSRLEYCKDAALITCGVSKSGKSSLLFGEEVDNTSSRVGIIPRFVRSIFDDGIKGDIPTAIEVSIIHVEDEDMYDLINPISFDSPITQQDKKLLKLRWSKTCGTYIENVSRSLVSNAEDFMTLFHECMAMRALLQLHIGRNMDTHASHLVIEINLLASANVNKTIILPRSKMTFIELGDALSVHAGEQEKDRLQHLTTRGERSRVELMKCVSELADMNENEEEEFDPLTLPSELFQKSTLTCTPHLFTPSLFWTFLFY